MMAARNATQLSADLGSTTRWGWRFSRLGRAVRAAEKRYAADRAESRRRRDQRLSEVLGSGERTWGPAELERKRAEVNLMADLMTTLKDAAPAAQEESGVPTVATRRSSVTDRQKVSRGRLPPLRPGRMWASSTRILPALPRETEVLAEGRYGPRRHLISMTAIAASLLSILWVTHEGYTAHQQASAPRDSPGVSFRPYERMPISSPVPDFSAIQRPGPGGAYATALQIQNAEYQGASGVWCVLADPASKDCATTMRRSFRTHEGARRMVFLVTTSVGKMNRDRTSVEILLRRGDTERHAFPLEWVDGRWQADPVTIPAAKEKGGLYTRVVADARYGICVEADC
jgi:hypothetical protein